MSAAEECKVLIQQSRKNRFDVCEVRDVFIDRRKPKNIARGNSKELMQQKREEGLKVFSLSSKSIRHKLL